MTDKAQKAIEALDILINKFDIDKDDSDLTQTIRTYITSTAGQGGDAFDLNGEAIMLARGYFAQVGIEASFFDDVAGLACREILELRDKVAALQPHPPQPDKCEGLLKALDKTLDWLGDEIFDDDDQTGGCTQEERAENISQVLNEALAKYKETT